MLRLQMKANDKAVRSRAYQPKNVTHWIKIDLIIIFDNFAASNQGAIKDKKPPYLVKGFQR